MGKIKDITGQTFGLLTVLRFVPLPEIPRTNWECRCECGRVTMARGTHLRVGNTRSCGCAQSNVPQHGLTQTPEYIIWQGMKRRCSNPLQRDYKYYGGRGISVCPEWAADFSAFYRDMGPRPSAKHSIEREENNGNYEPSNCRWATALEQSRNKRAHGSASAPFSQPA